jgi:hypothetical protein
MFGSNILFSNSVKEYNKLRKNLKKQFYNSFVNKINELHPNDSKSFWQSPNKLKKGNNQQQTTINDVEWVEHYKSLLIW